MLNRRSLRFRLAVWYFCSVAAICALAAGGYWLAVRSALDRAVDQGLRYRLTGLHQFLDGVTSDEPSQIVSRFAEIYEFGELYQVFDAHGALIAQSHGLARRVWRPRPPASLEAEIVFENGGPHDFPMRLAWKKVTIAGRVLILGAADPQRKYQGVLDAFTSVLLLSTPVVLTLAIVVGVWLGRRALAPVARITEDARAISDQNLSARLAVPASGDELQQLSETLNAMLGRIEASFSRVRQFTADASHELRAPLTLIHTAAEYSLRRERSRADLLESLQRILRASQRTRQLIDQLLFLARGDAEMDPRPLVALDAAPLLREVADEARAIAGDKPIAVDLRLASGVLPLRADEASLRRLLVILVDNAIKFTPAGGTITLQGDRGDGYVTLSVADTGAGIARDDLPHVFERFWRADKVRARDAGGAGLGLPIARQIAEAHRAALTVESEAGAGSIFTCRFPEDEERAESG